MFKEDIQKWAQAARAKAGLLDKNPLGYLVASMLAGLFVGFGICLIFTIQGLLGDFAGAKIVMGYSFAIALSLVVIAGAELFTGNNLVMTLGALKKTVSWGQVLKVWAICWIGNLLGSVLCALLFVGAGFLNGPLGEVFASAALAKTQVPFLPLLIRGILCNILVCLAVWSSGKIQDGAGKILIIALCLATFIISGFEHSIANMTLLSIGLFAKTSVSLGLGPVIYNLVVVTLGNMIGGIGLVALPYALIARD
ncbi:MAG: formate/nitrite transporter family protein [Tissierellia bacterium]|nr:formate/nitrite transporter family protein [Tissierellia bacterium]